MANTVLGQTRRFADRRGDATATNDCTSASDPCSLARAFAAAVSGDPVAFRVPSAGSSVTFDEDTDMVIGDAKEVQLRAYERGRASADVAGTLVVRDTLRIGSDARLLLGTEITLAIQNSKLELDGGDLEAGFLPSSVAGGHLLVDNSAVQIVDPDADGCPSIESKVTLSGKSTLAGACTLDNTSVDVWLTFWDQADWFVHKPMLTGLLPGLTITNVLTIDANATFEINDGLDIHMLVPHRTSNVPHMQIDGVLASGKSSDSKLYLLPDPAYAAASDTCWRIKGSGALGLPFTHATDAGLCIEVAQLTSTGESKSRADGRVYFTKTQQIAGSYTQENVLVEDTYLDEENEDESLDTDTLTLGHGRTEFWALELLRGDLSVIADSATYVDPQPDVDPNTGWCEIDDEFGVHLFTGATIERNVILEGMHQHKTYTDDIVRTGFCGPGLYLRGIRDPADPGAWADPKASTVYTTIKGDLEAREDPNAPGFGGYVFHDDWEFHHGLILEGDLVMEDATIVFESSQFNALTGPTLASMTLNRCVATRKADYKTSMLVMRGSGQQFIHLPTHDDVLTEAARMIEIGTLIVDKPGGLLQIQGDKYPVSVGVLDVRAGMIVTGYDGSPLLNVDEGLIMHHTRAARSSLVKSNGQTNLYAVDAPNAVVYLGNGDATIGEEIGSSIASLSIAKPGSKVQLTRPLTVTRAMQLIAGNLELHRITDNAVPGSGWVAPDDKKNATLHIGDLAQIGVYEGDITYAPGQPGSIKLSAKAFTTPAVSAPSVLYLGGRDRTFGNLIPGAPTYLQAARQNWAYRIINVESGCIVNGKPAHPVLTPNHTYTVFHNLRGLLLRKGAIDIKGGLLNFVNYETGVQIEFSDTGILCNTKDNLGCAPVMGKSGPFEPQRDTTLTVQERIRLYAAQTPIPLGRVLITETADSTAWTIPDAQRERKPADQQARFVTYGQKTTLPRIDSHFPHLVFLGPTSGEPSVTISSLQAFYGDVTFTWPFASVNVGDLLHVKNGKLTANDRAGSTKRKQIKIGNALWIEKGTADLRCADVSAPNAYFGLNPHMTPSSSSLQLGNLGRLAANTLFYIAPDSSDKAPSRLRLNDACPKPLTLPADTPVGLYLEKQFDFFGSGDVRDHDDANTNGVHGRITFTGQTTVTIVDHPNAQLGDVIVDGQDAESSIVQLMSNVTQHSAGKLELLRGWVIPGRSGLKWRLLNTAADTLRNGALTPKPGTGAVSGGSRFSYLDGIPLTRALGSNQVLANVGYYFPAGRYFETGTGADVFRPIAIQVTNGASRFDTLVVTLPKIAPDTLVWPDDNLHVPGKDGSLELNTIAGMFWQVRYDGPDGTDLTANVRLAATDLPNVNDISGLRIVQWDCDGTNPRLAGRYDLDSDNDADGFRINDYINGVPTITQEGARIRQGPCTLFGIASNFAQNPISLPDVGSGFARVQLVNTSDKSLNLALNGTRVVNHWAGGEATGFLPFPAGEGIVTLSPVQDSTAAPMLQVPVRLSPQTDYIAVIYGSGEDLKVAMQREARMAARNAAKVDLLIVHTMADKGEVDVRLLDDRDNTNILRGLSNNLPYGVIAPYVSVDPLGYNVEVSTADNATVHDIYRLELDQHEGEAVLLALVDISDATGIMTVTASGRVGFPPVVTSMEEADGLPTVFALHGNYPNPFNPSTRIMFDLPERAAVTVQIIDLLGRKTMELHHTEMEAGFGRTVELGARSLSSGTYLYRVIAETATGKHMDTGRMVLVK